MVGTSSRWTRCGALSVALFVGGACGGDDGGEASSGTETTIAVDASTALADGDFTGGAGALVFSKLAKDVNSVYVLDLAANTVQEIGSGTPLLGQWQLIPGTRTLLNVVPSDASDAFVAHRIDLRTGESKELVKGFQSARLSPGGRRLAITRPNEAIDYRTPTGRPVVGTEHPNDVVVLHDLDGASPKVALKAETSTSFYFPTWCGDDALVALRSEHETRGGVELEAGEYVEVNVSTGVSRTVVDGVAIAAAAAPPQGKAASNAIPLNVQCSPDGSRLAVEAFLSTSAGQAPKQLFVVERATGAIVSQSWLRATNISSLTWRADGKEIAAIVDRAAADGSSSIEAVLVEAATGKATRLALPDAETGPSPPLLFAGDNVVTVTEEGVVFVLDPAGGPKRLPVVEKAKGSFAQLPFANTR